jgi:hypothetical protein
MRSQQGLSFIGFVFVAAVAAVFFLVAAQAVPAHNEYFAIKKVLAAVANEVGASGSKPQFSASFDRRADIDGISTVKGADIRVSKVAGGTELTMEYEKRQNLFKYVWLVFDFKATATAK